MPMTHVSCTNIKMLNKLKKPEINKDFENIYDWFVDNKLSKHFEEDKTKSILFASNRRIKGARKLNIKYKECMLNMLNILVVFWMKLCLKL